jgi:hydrogenase maturation protein HypF
VRNTNENVQIRVSGEAADIEKFLAALKAEAPPASFIQDVQAEEIDFEIFKSFTILSSDDVSDDVTEISPDIAVCHECLKDMEQPGNRYHYPFVNCTNCGPRFSIISDLPYDRAKTTMQSFVMCPDCKSEYDAVLDRRFHAQPTACARCGPWYELHAKNKPVETSADAIASSVAGCLEQGSVMLIRGLGGMHLACDAFSLEAVGKLRLVKKRDMKPFAVMFRDIESLRNYAHIDDIEMASLLSWRRPIVLLHLNHAGKKEIPESLNAGLGLIGVMLPYMPFHYLLFGQLKTNAIVLTSGNISSEPILIDNREAMEQFPDLPGGMVLHNRDIFNRTDDSVVRIIRGRERVFRRSRGYAPAPIRTSLETGGILAFGAELTNCFCVGNGQKAFLSQHIGDLRSLETIRFYEETIEKFLKLFRVKPSLLAVDLHPDYISTKTALNFPGLPVEQIQHHHAHIAACMAEHHLDETVLGVAFDGTGYGDDGHTWGSEFFLCDLNSYTRKSHFSYLPLPGGDMATEEPWRMAVSWLYKVYGSDFLNLDLPVLKEIGPEKTRLLVQMIDRNINCPLTCGAGRLFDAVASLLGLVQTASFQAEGPIRLESLVLQCCADCYGFETGEVVTFDTMLKEIIADFSARVDNSIIATKFHNTIISVIFESVKRLREQSGINKVVLSGGVFQNRYLLEGTINVLTRHHFEVYAHESVPSNDGGIALGQLAIASKRRSITCV